MSLPMSWQSQALLSATDLKLGESGNPPSGKCTVMIEDAESFRNSHLGTHQRKTHHFGAQQLREQFQRQLKRFAQAMKWNVREVFVTIPSSIKSLYPILPGSQFE